ncbi:MAG TPA: P-loop NTPase fold protein [Gammaproteobacteria bacterium]|nr:P-loop NTPase fold protein [Gammaproteobacteria bacterium]
MFDADRPILKSSQDLLDRATFAKYLARCMLDHQDPDSLVVGLYGGWGTGKTSIINMAIEELNFAASNLLDAEKPIVMHFNTWSYSGQNQLIYSFFSRLAGTLRSVPYLENADRITYLLELYVAFFTHKSAPKPPNGKQSWSEKFGFKKKEPINAWELGRDLTAVKAELNELLKQQKHKIIIIIDNISRLYPNEIKQIFQIVKSMGDYVNTVYLLAFDKEYVTRAINSVDGSGGEDLVEKVIQLPFTVPPILQQDLEILLAARLSDILPTVPEDAWNTAYWAEVFNSSLKFFFKNGRDITRYVNTLNFSYPRVRDVVNPVDFFALTAIEVFSAKVYFGIRDNKDLFTDLLDNVYVMDKDHVQKDKARCDEILSRAEHVSHAILLDLLLQLFPRLRRLYQPTVAYYHSEIVARKLRRICSPDLFEVYFRLSLQTGQIPISEFNTILSFAADPLALDQALTRLNQDIRIESFLDQLDGKILETLPMAQLPALVNALLDNGDLFPMGNSDLLNLNTPMRIHRIIQQLLNRLSTPEKRFTVLQNAIHKASKSLYILVHEIHEQGHEHSEESDTFLPVEFRKLTPEQLHLLQKAVIDRIEVWAKNGSLEKHPQLLPILITWHAWDKSDACRRFIEQMTSTDRGLIAFLEASLRNPIMRAMTKYEKTSEWETYLVEMAALIPPKSLESHAIALFEDAYFEKLKETEQLALMIFLDLIKAPTVKMIPKTTV